LDIEMIVDEDGRIANWPSGFCEYTEEWLERLL
jgi:hypothetical protein